MYQAVLILILVSVGIAFIRRSFNGTGAGLKRPPGPRGLPLIGNVLQVPRQVCWIWSITHWIWLSMAALGNPFSVPCGDIRWPRVLESGRYGLWCYCFPVDNRSY